MPRNDRRNEYFVPGEGISREVILADICRYLGNDALVRPAPHQGTQGYMVRAYRNLTSDMIVDLKNDSARWEASGRKEPYVVYREREARNPPDQPMPLPYRYYGYGGYQPTDPYPGFNYRSYGYPPLPPTSALYAASDSPYAVLYSAGNGAVRDQAMRLRERAVANLKDEANTQEKNEQQTAAPQDSAQQSKKTTSRQSPDPTDRETGTTPEGDISKENQTSKLPERETDTTEKPPSSTDGLTSSASTSGGQDSLEVRAELDGHSANFDNPQVPSSSPTPEQGHGVAPPLKRATFNTSQQRGTTSELGSPNPNRFLGQFATTQTANPMDAVSNNILPDTAAPVIHLDNRLEKRSLNLVCYRSAVYGCTAHQIHVVRPRQSIQITDESLQTILSQHPDLISTDVEFLEALKEGIGEDTRPAIVDIDPLAMQDLLHCYHHPSTIATQQQGKGNHNAYIHWVFALKGKDSRYLLEFVEGWSGQRIAVAASIPLLVSTVVGILLSFLTANVQTAFTVAGFILTMGTVFLALVGVLSGTE
ncbi:hypothetical protein FQN54_002708 [Arachnomyces sp. PD_36]|nr:hypothetical protein FQN54_002708 [Arachnomyces sp. PD_36]